MIKMSYNAKDYNEILTTNSVQEIVAYLKRYMQIDAKIIQSKPHSKHILTDLQGNTLQGYAIRRKSNKTLALISI